MAATFSTLDAKGLGYQTGLFSADPANPIDQIFFDAAFAGRINQNKIYKETYHCNIIGDCGMSQWLDEFMGYETDCHPEYTLLETYGEKNLIQIAANATVPQYPGTVALHLNVNSQYVNGQFILPQVGNTIVASPKGYLVKVTAISQASSTDVTVTVQQRDTTGNTGAFNIVAGDTLLVLSGSLIDDCDCPTGQFAVPDLPVETDLRMITIGDKGSLCGDALNKCQWLKIPFTDECGNVLQQAWYTEALQTMYRRFEDRKYYERLLNPFFGMIPLLRARGIKWTPTSNSEFTVDDVREWKKQLDIYGIKCREFAIFAGRDNYSKWQKMLNAAGVTNLQYSERPLNDCAWINLNYCGIMVENLKLHIYEECSFSDGKKLGGPNMVFPDSAIIIPMCDRPACSRSNNRNGSSGSDMKMVSMVYFKSNDGRVWDNLTDSNGILGPRNTFGTGCETHEWSIKTRFLQELHCMNWWGYMNL